MDAPADRRPDVAQNEGKPDGREGGDDRDEALAGEKAEVLRQADLVVANEERAGDETDCNAAENAGVDRGDSHDRLGLGAVQPGDDAHGAEQHHVADHRGEGRHAVILGEPEGDADRKNQRQVPEDRTTRLLHDLRDALRNEFEARRADTEQDAGHRQDGHRQHQRLADLLKQRENSLQAIHAVFPSDRRSSLLPSLVDQ